MLAPQTPPLVAEAGHESAWASALRRAGSLGSRPWGAELRNCARHPRKPSGSGEDYDLSSVRGVLEDLVLARSVERVEMEEPEPMYTRPDVLLRAIGVVEVVKSGKASGSSPRGPAAHPRKRVK